MNIAPKKILFSLLRTYGLNYLGYLDLALQGMYGQHLAKLCLNLADELEESHLS